MRTANVSHYLFRLSGAVCFFLFFSISAQAQNYDFSGNWNFNSFISGPGAPWWERGTLTVAQDGSFTGSGTQSNGASDSPSGSLSISSSGIEMSLDGQSSSSLCLTDASNSIMSCTETLSDGASNLIILSRQPSSITLSDLAGTWEGSLLSSGPTSMTQTVSETVNSDGTFTGSYTSSDGASGSLSGTLSISTEGMVTCVSGACKDPTYASFINPTATVMVGTSGAAASYQDANLFVLARQAASYSIGNLVGIWEESSLASGPGAPWWQSGLLIVNPDGSCLLSYFGSDGQQNSQSGTVSISPSGVITVNLGTTAMGYVDPNLDVMVLTSTWPDGATHEISILTNASSAALGTSPAVTWGTGSISPSTNSGSPYAASSPGTTGTTGSTGFPHGATAPGSLQGVNKTGQKPASVQPAPSGETGGSPGPTNGSPAGAAPAQSGSEANHRSTHSTAPGAPTIVVVTAGNSQALVNFKLPSNDGGNPITTCTVTANPGGIKTSRVGSPIRVSNLQNGTSYTFNVTAANKEGTGPASDNSRSIAVGRVPEAPEIQTVTMGKGQAQISFTPPASDGGSKITSYTVTSSSGQKASGTRSPITVRGLSAGKAYTFTVTATNKTGTGPAAAPRAGVPRRHGAAAPRASVPRRHGGAVV